MKMFDLTNCFTKCNSLTTKDGKNIEVWSFKYPNDKVFLSEWAKHFRSMYIEDSLIDDLRSGTNLSRSEYLLKFIFPDKTEGWGPAIRSGDFSEILVADFLEYIKKYWVPRIRYNDKPTRNSSTQGSDVVAFKFKEINEDSRTDELLIFEVKAQYSGKKSDFRLQEAVDDSYKDETRVGEFLNYARRRYLREKEIVKANKVKRFQNESDNPYVKIFGATAFFDDKLFDPNSIQQTDCTNHKNKDILRLLVFSGKDMMNLVHSLYERAANEA